MNDGKIVFDASVSAKWVIEEQDCDKARAHLGTCVENRIGLTQLSPRGAEDERGIAG